MSRVVTVSQLAKRIVELLDLAWLALRARQDARPPAKWSVSPTTRLSVLKRATPSVLRRPVGNESSR